MILYTHASRQGQSCLLARNFPEFVGQLSQLTLYKIDLVAVSLSDPKSRPREERKALFTVFVYQKKSSEIMTHAIDCFSYHT